MNKKNEFISPSVIARLKNPDRLKEIQAIFRDGNSKMAAEIAADKPLYDSLQRDAVTLGYAAQRSRDRVATQRASLGLNPHAPGRPAHNFTPEELAAREEFPLAEATMYFKGTPIGETPRIFTKLRDSDPQKAYRLELAAKSYDLITRTPVPPAAPAPKPDEPFQLIDSLCDRYSMPRGSMVTHDQYTAIICAYADSELAKSNAAAPAPAQAPAAPPVEPPAPTNTSAATV